MYRCSGKVLENSNKAEMFQICHHVCYVENRSWRSRASDSWLNHKLSWAKGYLPVNGKSGGLENQAAGRPEVQPGPGRQAQLETRVLDATRTLSLFLFILLLL